MEFSFCLSSKNKPKRSSSLAQGQVLSAGSRSIMHTKRQYCKSLQGTVKNLK